MSEVVNITSVTANTPVDIYYCDSFSASCVFVATVSTFPYQFVVPPPYDENNIVVKIIDSQSCVRGEIIPITPTPTPSITPSNTVTPTTSQTPTPTLTPTTTVTPTVTQTPTVTPTYSPTPSVTPVISYHTIGQSIYSDTSTCCTDVMTINKYYTYLNEASTIPVLNAKVYQTAVGTTLYNLYNGNNKFIKMTFGSSNYAVQINTQGEIISFTLCT